METSRTPQHRRMFIMTETEIKLRWPDDRGDATGYLRNHGYTPAPRLLEVDQLYDRITSAAPKGELRELDQIIRLRRTGSTSTVTYKGPANREVYKSREEIEFDISDADAFHTVLERLGYQPQFRYEKYRTKFARESELGIVTLDETPIGVFLELEGPEDWIDTTAMRLGFKKDEYLTISYASLYREYQRIHLNAPRDMTFQH